MRNAFKKWLGPVLGTVIVVSVGTAFVGSAIASDDERSARASDDATIAGTSDKMAQGLDVGELMSRLQAQGYRDIYEVEHEHGRYEVEAKDADGRSVELYVDPASGEVLRSKLDD